jgi:hypothetical protein
MMVGPMMMVVRPLPPLSAVLGAVLVASGVLAVDVAVAPSSAEAQTRRRGASHRSGRSVGRARSRSRRGGQASSRRGRRGRASVRRGRRLPRRGRRVRLRRGPTWVVLDTSDGCDFVDAQGYCMTYVTAGAVPWHVAGGAFAELFTGTVNAPWSPRTTARGNAGIGPVPAVGGEVRAGLGIDRFRFGMLGQVGAMFPLAPALGPSDGAFEEGSVAAEGALVTTYAYFAWVPRLSWREHLWLGLRAGIHLPFLPVRAAGRAYDQLERPFPSAGPEVGLRLTFRELGVLFTVFADAAQPGTVQLSATAMWDGLW